MRRIQISYLIEHPEYIPQLAQWLFEQWDSILGEKTPETRIKKLKTHMNRGELPIAWVAHANGQPLGTAALRVHDLEGREDLTPWHYVPPSRTRPGRERYTLSICSRSTNRRGIHAWAGQCSPRAFGTSGPVISCRSGCRQSNEALDAKH